MPTRYVPGTAKYQVITTIGKETLAIQLNDQAARYRPIFFAQSEGVHVPGETQKNIHYTCILELKAE